MKQINKLGKKDNYNEECKEFNEQNYISSEEIIIFTNYDNDEVNYDENNDNNDDNIDDNDTDNNNNNTKSVVDIELGNKD